MRLSLYVSQRLELAGLSRELKITRVLILTKLVILFSVKRVT